MHMGNMLTQVHIFVTKYISKVSDFVLILQ